MSKKKLTLLITGVFLIIALLVSLLWPNANYDGVKKQAGEAAVEFAWQMSSGINYVSVFGTLKVTYENVRAGDENNKLCNNEFSSTEKTEGNRFLVDVTYRTVFGIPIDSETYHICRFGN